MNLLENWIIIFVLTGLVQMRDMSNHQVVELPLEHVPLDLQLLLRDRALFERQLNLGSVSERR